MEATLRVAIFAQLLPGSAGGIETNLVELVHNLRVDGGLRPLLIGPGGSSAWLRERVPDAEVMPWTVIRYQVEDSFAAYQAASLPKRLAIMLRRARVQHSKSLATQGHHVAAGHQLTSVLRTQGTELLHFPYQRYFETDLPFIFEPWDLQHLHYPENFSEKEFRLREYLYREACLRANLVVVPTRWGKGDLISKFGLDARKIAVITRGPGQLPAGDLNPTSSHPLPPRYIVYPAKFWPHKNHGRLFDALAYLRARGCVVPLVCTGDSSSALPDLLRQSISRHGLEDQISFLGHLERTELTRVLVRAEMLVFPSLFEGFGIPVLEAMSLGVPVACSRIGPLEEIACAAAEQFDANDPIDIARSIHFLWMNSDRRKELKELGIRRAQGHGWVQAARDFVLCYKRVAGRLLSAEDRARFGSLIQ